MTLKKGSIKPPTLLASSIAGIIGSGWLLGPLACAKIAGPAALFSWILAGLFMIIVATTFVMLARTLQIAGGTVRFLQLSHGHFAGFSFSWISWLAWMAVPPIETMALVQYASNYVPHLMTIGTDPVLTMPGMLISVGILFSICFINSLSTHIYEKVNHFVLAFKILIPAVTVIIIFISHFSLHNFYMPSSFMPHGIQSIFVAMPLAGVIYSYIGFNPAVQLASESKNPHKAIPIAIFGSLIFCIILFTLIQIAFIGGLPSSSLANGWAHINFAGDRGPFAGLLAAFGFFWFVKLLYADALVSPYGTAMVQSLSTSRISYAMSQNGYLPSWIQKVNKHHSPAIAIVTNTLIGCAFFLPFPSWQHLVGFLVSCIVIGYATGPMALMVITKTHPERFGNYPRWMIHLLCLLAFYICNLMIYWSGWSTIYKVGIVFALGYIAMIIKRAITPINRPLHFIQGIWVLFYIIGMVIMSYFSSFGGDRLIKFGYDFIVVAVFSTFIYWLATRLIKNPPDELDAILAAQI